MVLRKEDVLLCSIYFLVTDLWCFVEGMFQCRLSCIMTSKYQTQSYGSIFLLLNAKVKMYGDYLISRFKYLTDYFPE